MPLYEGECKSGCGRFEDIMKLREYEVEGLICPECGSKARTVISAIRTVGPMSSKPLVIDQIGQTFTSKAQMRRYFKAHPDRRIVDPNDTAFKNHRDLAREKADKAAKLHGFNDREDRAQKTKADMAQRKKISQGEGRIYSNT